MTIANWIGVAMIASVFVGVFVFGAHAAGFLTTLYVFGAAAAAVAFISVGVHLATGG